MKNEDKDHSAYDDHPLEPAAFSRGWPELAGIFATALIIWFMFHYANGHY